MAVFTVLLAAGQARMSKESESRLHAKIPAISTDIPVLPLQPPSVVPHSKSALETQIGSSKYDMQTKPGHFRPHRPLLPPPVNCWWNNPLCLHCGLCGHIFKT